MGVEESVVIFVIFISLPCTVVVFFCGKNVKVGEIVNCVCLFRMFWMDDEEPTSSSHSSRRACAEVSIVQWWYVLVQRSCSIFFTVDSNKYPLSYYCKVDSPRHCCIDHIILLVPTSRLPYVRYRISGYRHCCLRYVHVDYCSYNKYCTVRTLHRIFFLSFS